jgi:hypothetical protein
MTRSEKNRRQARHREGRIGHFLFGGARPGFLRGVRTILVVGWVVFVAGVAPRAYRDRVRISEMPPGPERDSQLSDLIRLAITSLLAPGLALAALGYGVFPSAMSAQLGVGPVARALPIEEDGPKKKRRRWR